MLDILIDNILFVQFGERVFQWLRTVFGYLSICFYTIMRQTSYKDIKLTQTLIPAAAI
jgi:hypothetical protein